MRWLNTIKEEQVVEEKFDDAILCVSIDRDLYEGTYVAVVRHSGVVLCGNAEFQANYYEVPDDFDALEYIRKQRNKSIVEGTEADYSEFWNKAKLVKRVEHFPHAPKFSTPHTAGWMFLHGLPLQDKIVVGEDPKWRII